jgi:type II secretory pathway pseudopilin PulG
MSAFQISPEEIAGYAYLGRGTLSQSLSESNNAYQLEAARDSGIRPLLSILQDFINLHLFPIVAPELAEMCYVELCGLDKDSPDKEASLLTTEASLHMTVNELLMAVEKPIIPKFLGGDYPLNPAIQQILKENVPFGVILENFLGIKGASQDPKYQFIQNNFYFQYLQYMNQMETQKQQMQMQQQQAQQEQQAQAQQPPPGQDAQQAPAGQPAPQGAPQGAPQEPVMISPQDISFQDIPSGIKSVQQSLGKSEPAAILTKQQNLIVSNVMDSWAKEAEEELKRILESLDKNGN